MTAPIVYSKEISPGRWLAATGAAPYFCFEAKTHKEVLEVTKRALRFYGSVKERLDSEVKSTRERERAIPTFSSKDKVLAKELVDA